MSETLPGLDDFYMVGQWADPPGMKERMEGLFCAKGKSTCEFEKVNCVCAGCPVYGEYSLSDSFYCAIGAAQ